MTTNEFTPFVWIDSHNHSLIKEILNPNFNGDTELDSTLNQAEVHIHQAGEIIVNYPQGAFPLDVAKSAVDSTNALLKLYRKKYGIAIAKPVEQAFHAYFNMWYYSGNPLFPSDLYKKKFFQCEEKLFTAIRTGNVALSSFIQKPPKKRKKSSLGKGRQTAFMEHQREVFDAYLLDHPITSSVSAITRAHQCWLQHQKEWDKHAKDGSGYSDYKALTRSK